MCTTDVDTKYQLSSPQRWALDKFDPMACHNLDTVSENPPNCAENIERDNGDHTPYADLRFSLGR